MDDAERLLRDLGRTAREDEVFRPLGEDFEERLAGRLEAERAAGREVRRGQTVPFPVRPARRGRRPWTWTAAAAAVAAAVVVAVLQPWGWLHELPPYELGEAQGLARTRSDPASPAAEPLTLQAGAPFGLVVYPEGVVRGPVRARVFLAHGGTAGSVVEGTVGEGTVGEELETTTDTATTGAVEIRGALGRGGLATPGSRTLVVALGRPWTSLDPASGPPETWEGWRTLRLPVVLVAAE